MYILYILFRRRNISLWYVSNKSCLLYRYRLLVYISLMSVLLFATYHAQLRLLPHLIRESQTLTLRNSMPRPKDSSRTNSDSCVHNSCDFNSK